MRPAEVLKKMRELRESWRKQGFSYTMEQQKEYDRLLKLRRERVAYFYKNGLVAKSGVKKEVEINKEKTQKS
tara:strand:- start:230 stop:445 length:216 start_codon:yes stop_codon:yes gene_type:complete